MALIPERAEVLEKFMRPADLLATHRFTHLRKPFAPGSGDSKLPFLNVSVLLLSAVDNQYKPYSRESHLDYHKSNISHILSSDISLIFPIDTY